MPRTPTLVVDLNTIPVDFALSVSIAGKSVAVLSDEMPLGTALAVVRAIGEAAAHVLSGNDVEPSPRVVKVRPERTPRVKPPAAPQGDHVCTEPGCGRAFKLPQGLGRHRSTAHKAVNGNGKVPAPSPGTSAASELLLRCDDCAFTAGPVDIAAMRQHTTDSHDRVPSNPERTPRAAKAAVSS